MLLEAIHWRYHPVADRILSLAEQIGPLREISASFSVSIPTDNIRWDLDLAGGGLMDLGCYCVHMVRSVAGSEPEVVAAAAVEETPGIDATMDAVLRFEGGIDGNVSCSMIGTTRWPESMTLRVVGESGSMVVLNPLLPQRGYRIRAELASGESVDEGGETETTWLYQLRAFADIVSGARSPLLSPQDPVANMRVIDDIYRAAGLAPRG